MPRLPGRDAGNGAPALGVPSSAELLAYVERASTAPASPVAEALVGALSGELGAGLVGVLFYGSRLNRTAGPQSDWDFFVVVDRYRGAHRRWLHARLNALLPPSIYRRQLTLDDESTAPCKLSFVSEADLERYTSASAPDSYLFGRLSKRVAVVHARDDDARRRMVEALARSVVLCARWALAETADRVGVEALARHAIAFSYRCEERIEGASRAPTLFEADTGYFREVYARAAAALAAVGWARLDAGGQVTRSAAATSPDRKAVEQLMRRSRRRARLRWLKNILTFEGWFDYVVAKLERHQGERLALSERERRHPLWTAIRQYLRLRRAGRLSGRG